MPEPSKVALVTGASSGIGKEIALQLLGDGFVVYAVARRLDLMQELADNGAVALRMDVTIEADVVAVVKQIERDHGGVDVLVNNAGIGVFGPVESVTMGDARQQFEVNLFGLARITQLVLPQMRARGSGTIVNMSSLTGRIYFPFGAWYHASKHALEGWSDCLRLELAPYGVRVIVVAPGIIKTDFDVAMVANMRRRTDGGPYQENADRFIAAVGKSFEGTGTPPSAVARLVSKAVRSRRPKTRYYVGRHARTLLFLRNWFGDRIYDYVTTVGIGIEAKRYSKLTD